MTSFVTPFYAKTEMETMRHAAEMAALVRAPAFITLSGDLGAGKTAWARGFIRGFLNDPTVDVISPTYPLLQIYESSKGLIYHYDLYRLDDDEINEMTLQNISWDESRAAICLVEWAEKLPLSLHRSGWNVNLFLDVHGADVRTIDVKEIK